MNVLRIWDLPVRLFHWLLAIAIATSWLSGEEGWMDVHFWSGYVVLTLILFRLAWGFVGSPYARFSGFLTGPRAWLVHLRSLPDRMAAPTAGHNPLGGLMVLFMLVYFLVQPLLGLFSSDDLLAEGPLAAKVSNRWVETASDWHHEMGELVPWIVGVHVAAALFYLLWKRQNLIAGMFTGVKPVPPETAAPVMRPNALALIIVVLAAGIVGGIVGWGRAG